jgi:hypothetical protein
MMLRRIHVQLGKTGRLDSYAATRTGKCAFSSSTSVWAKKMPDRPPLVDEHEFTESFLKGSGPGGQKIASSSLGNSHGKGCMSNS